MLWETDAVAETFERFNLPSICCGDAGGTDTDLPKNNDD